MKKFWTTEFKFASRSGGPEFTIPAWKAFLYVAAVGTVIGLLSALLFKAF